MVDRDEPSTDAEEVRDLEAMLSAIEQEIARLEAKAEDPPRRGPPLWGSLLLLLSPVACGRCCCWTTACGWEDDRDLSRTTARGDRGGQRAAR